MRAADEFVHEIFLIKESGEPKICQFYSQIYWVFEQDVFWLDVSVCDVHFVHVIKRIKKLLGDINNLELGERVFLLLEKIKELAVLNILANDVIPLGVVKQFVDAHDVRVAGLFQNVQLAYH